MMRLSRKAVAGITLAATILAYSLGIAWVYSLPEESSTPKDLSVVRVTNHPGGQVDPMLKLTGDLMEQEGLQVQLKGYCASACTLFLRIDNVCVFEGTQLQFHAPYYGNPRTMIAWSDKLTVDLSKYYPPKILKWIENNGGLTEHLITLEGPELDAMYPRCAVLPHPQKGTE